MASVRLFVYGTLKRDGIYHQELQGAPFLGVAETAPGYELVKEGEYLALVPAPSARPVRGELFEIPISLLPALDEFEGAAYQRQEISVRLLDAKLAEKPGSKEAWALALAYLRKPR